MNLDQEKMGARESTNMVHRQKGGLQQIFWKTFLTDRSPNKLMDQKTRHVEATVEGRGMIAEECVRVMSQDILHDGEHIIRSTY